ncbi:MAG TPA: LacI family DNA-binding transcriptional regulator [Thermoanaerobaculia bacterium]|nr:LacI family DNA-binding transcriptional regulator [Thermoanaerobaculia bacterium]
MARDERRARGTRSAGRTSGEAGAAAGGIREVARAAGVSVATVSRVVNGTAVVRDETKRRVEAEIARLRYAPNAAARSLITNRTSTVGVVLPDIWGEYFSEVIRGIDLAARQAGYHVLVSSSHSDAAETREVLRAMNGRVDGVVVMAPHASPQALASSFPPALPAVFLNSAPGGAGAPSLSVDNRGGARAMVAHLLALGHRRLAFLNGPASNRDAAERRRGAHDALRAAGLATEPVLEIPGDFTEESGRVAGEEVLRRSPRPTALFAANDSMAIGALYALRRARASIPADVAVAGFDDVPIARFASPPLSTVRHDIRSLGARALARLVAEIEGRGDGLPDREVLPFHLVLRYSTEGVDTETTTEPSHPLRAGAPVPYPTTDRRRKAR